MLRILFVILTMAVFILAGVFLRRRGRLGPEAAPRMNAFALHVTLPAGVFVAVHATPFEVGALRPALLFGLVTVLMTGVGAVAARALGYRGARAAVVVNAVALANTAFVGYPVVAATFGEAGLARAVLIDQLGMQPVAFTLGVLVAKAGGGDGGAFRWGEALRSLLMPPLIALAAGIAWSLLGWPPLPAVLAQALRVVGAATVPIVMVSLGLVLRMGAVRGALGATAVVAVLRLFVAPLVLLLGARALAVEPELAAVATLEAGMPTMAFTLMLALRYRLDAELAAAFVGSSMIAAAVSLPLWLWALAG